MEKVNTEQIRAAYSKYLRSEMYELRDAYKNPSNAKYKAWDYCKNLQKDYNGTCLKVIGKNSQTFSAGFIGDVEDRETGELQRSFVYITKSYDRYMPLSLNVDL